MTESPLRIFVASASVLLTDHLPHGEGLIAARFLDALALRGHRLVVCADRVELESAPRYELRPVRSGRRESLRPLIRRRSVRREFELAGGAGAFDIVHWLFPQDRGHVLSTFPVGPVYVIGPLAGTWPRAAGDWARQPRLGDLVAGLIAPVRHRLELQTLRRVDLALRATPAGGAHLLERCQCAVRDIPFGVPVPEGVADPATSGDVLYVGRLVPEKGVMNLLEAYLQIWSQRPEARLVIAGDGPLLPAIRDRAARERSGPAIEVLGAVAHAGIPDLLGRAAVLVAPSVGEPFGMAVLEAMAAGLPVVGVEGSGPAWLLREQHGELVVTDNAPTTLASALNRLLADPGARRAIGRANRETVLRSYSIDAVVDATVIAYREALSLRIPRGIAA